MAEEGNAVAVLIASRVQYTSWAFTDWAGDSGLAPSMGSIGDRYDNAIMEVRTSIRLHDGDIWSQVRAGCHVRVVFRRDGDDPPRAAVGLLGGDEPGRVGVLLGPDPARQAGADG